MADLFGIQLIKFPDKFSILQTSQVSYFINTLVFQLSNKEDKKKICEVAKDHVSTLKFFKTARETLSIKNEHIEDILENIHKIYKEISSLLMIAFMHLSKKLEKLNKKEFFVYMNDFFYHEVLMTIQYTYKNNSFVREICLQYEKKPTQYGGPSWKYNIKVYNNLYFGEFDENEKRDGFGRLSLENGDKYEGF